jgi:hypothetical protein
MRPLLWGGFLLVVDAQTVVEAGNARQRHVREIIRDHLADGPGRPRFCYRVQESR